MRQPTVRTAMTVLALLLIPIVGQAQYLTILHFNDFHGQLLPKERDDASIGGIARLATMIDDTRDWNGPHNVTTLLLEAGDILQGTPLSTVFHGEPDFICLNMLGVDVMAVGNHEFDFGQENLDERMKQAMFPIISANIEYTNTMELLTKPYVTTEIEGVPALIFGVTSKDTPIESNAKNVAGLKFRDPIEVARKIVAQHRDDYPIIIALTHIGLDEDLKLAEAVDGIDILIGAHSHDAVREPILVGDTLVCQAGSSGAYLGQLDAFFVDGEIARYRGFLRDVDQTVVEDAAIASVVASYADELNDKIKRVIATSDVALDGVRDNLRSGETNLGDLIADILLRFSEADIAVMNGGGIRAGIDEGPITVEEIMTVLPFGNQLATVGISGEVLMEMLEFMASLPRPDGGFLQVAGASLTITGDRVSDVKVGGESLSRDETYKLALPEFLLTGGNGYTMFEKGSDPRYLGTTISSIVLDALEEMKTVDQEVDGRIVVR